MVYVNYLLYGFTRSLSFSFRTKLQYNLSVCISLLGGDKATLVDSADRSTTVCRLGKHCTVPWKRSVVGLPDHCTLHSGRRRTMTVDI